MEGVELALAEYGLSDKEIRVYVALLPLGSVSLQEIAKRLSLPRTTVYNTLSYLSTKGLVSKITKKGITHFEAIDPKKLVDRLNEKKMLVLSVLPQLEGLKKVIKESSNVEMYEGTKGIFSILSDVFKVKQQTYYFGSYSSSIEILNHLPSHARTIRMENKIPAKIVIDPYDEPAFKTKEYQKITQMRFLPSMKDFPLMVFIYGNKVALYTVKGDLNGWIIKNKEVAEAMRIIFDVYWGMAKPCK